MENHADIVIIGGGVVGLAVAYTLSSRIPEKTIVLLERNEKCGQETSSRNSEVIHAGLYYPADSMKTMLCVEGSGLLYAFCGRHQVAHQRIGKLIVAADDSELSALEKVYKQGTANGKRLEMLDHNQVRRLEPSVAAAAGLFSADTGIVDADGLVRALYYLSKQNGVIMLLKQPLTGVAVKKDGYLLQTPAETISADYVINAAGLYADKVAAMTGMDVSEETIHYCKGEYYKLLKKMDVRHLVYPTPGHIGLGIHMTLDLAGGQKFGPNAYYVDTVDYSMDDSHQQDFYQAAIKYFPAVAFDQIAPDYCGIRPKLQGPGQDFRDFVIREETKKGLPGWINLIGIESPGLTSCLAIGNKVTAMLAG